MTEAAAISVSIVAVMALVWLIMIIFGLSRAFSTTV